VVGVRRTQELGRYGEDVAERYLEAAGMRILDRNWRCPHGEIDVIAVDGRCLVVCEVKTRRSVTAGLPVEAVTRAKLARLRRLTGAWLESQEERYREIRIDVVSVLVADDGVPLVRHLRAVA
jgi:putative endonuclease